MPDISPLAAEKINKQMKKIILIIIIVSIGSFLFFRTPILKIINYNGKVSQQSLMEEINNFISSKFKKETENGGYIKVLKIKEFQGGNLVLARSRGKEGASFISLFNLGKDTNGKLFIKAKASTEEVYSPGFGVNRMLYRNSTLFFGNLNKKAWDPKTDKVKETNYSEMTVEFDDGKKVEEKIENDEGYVLIADNDVKIKDMKLYNNKGEIVNTYDEYYSKGADIDVNFFIPGLNQVKRLISGLVVSGGDTMPRGRYDAPREFIYKVKTDDGFVINVSYTSYPSASTGDKAGKQIKLNLKGGSISVGVNLEVYGTFNKETNTIEVKDKDEGDYIKTF